MNMPKRLARQLAMADSVAGVADAGKVDGCAACEVITSASTIEAMVVFIEWMFSTEPAVADFGTAGDMHDVTGDEAGHLRDEKNASVRDDITLGAVAKGVDIIEVF
jgi:hypothetical protein